MQFIVCIVADSKADSDRGRVDWKTSSKDNDFSIFFSYLIAYFFPLRDLKPGEFINFRLIWSLAQIVA